MIDFGWNQTCGTMHPTTFTHLGYTGTQICGDPVREIYTIFLTNRVYPDQTNIQIREVRKKWNTAVVNAIDQYREKQANLVNNPK